MSRCLRTTPLASTSSSRRSRVGVARSSGFFETRGFSKGQSRALLASGFAGLTNDDAEVDLDEVANALKQINALLRA